MKHILSYMRKAIEDYNMIEDGDKIAVALWWQGFYYYAYSFKESSDFLSKKV